MNINDKKKILVEYFRQYTQGYLLFSAGMDSCAVLGAAVAAGSNIVPIWADNQYFNRASDSDIKKQAKNLGSDVLIINDVVPNSEVKSNSNLRCFHCKNQILSTVPKDGKPVFDGTNVSDIGGYRPGKRALRAFGVKSPLNDLGITSAEAVEIALSFGADPLLAGLESCLATRINYGVEVTPERLHALRRIERFIIEKTMDFDVRCRIDDSDHIRIELTKPESFSLLADEDARRKLFDFGEPVSLFVTIDVLPSRPNTYDKRLKSPNSSPKERGEG